MTILPSISIDSNRRDSSLERFLMLEVVLVIPALLTFTAPLTTGAAAALFWIGCHALPYVAALIEIVPRDGEINPPRWALRGPHQ